MKLAHRAMTGFFGAAMLSGVALGTAGGAEAAPTTTEVSTGQIQNAAFFAAGEFECGPNNWVGKLVPENPPGGANFHNACVAHDRCYDQGSSVDRKVCDQRFRDAMYSACAGKGSLCKGVANVYYGAVRGVGWTFYEGSGANN
ncbi:phospholipase A2 [Demetria terragena]|uniref:phospholipase A2 n=1 Tax=Demetria terragena TaxID=63959 RepID=UPI0003A33240|nr:phospholipase A2 [Demetria terragena]